MKFKTLQLIQLFFVIFAIYSIFNYTGNQQKIVPLFCLLAAYGLERLNISKKEEAEVEGSKKASSKKGKGKDKDKDKGKDAIADNLNCLLKSKNPLIITDAIQYLLHDLGLLVSKAPANQVISRFIKSGNKDGTIGLFVLMDASKLQEGWVEWDKIAKFKKLQGQRYSTMIVWSNCSESEAGKLKYRQFPTNTKKVLANRNVVALSTYTFYLLYSMCKTGKLDIHEAWARILNHPGGVVSLKK